MAGSRALPALNFTAGAAGNFDGGIGGQDLVLVSNNSANAVIVDSSGNIANVSLGSGVTGANDVVMTSDHHVLFASSFQRRRTQCCVNGGGSAFPPELGVVFGILVWTCVPTVC